MVSIFAVSFATACLALAEPQEYDVIVAGGGPAGIGAGYMAAKRGAKTLVLEKSGRLGGMGVSALVSPFSTATDSPVVNHVAGRIGFTHSVDFHMADVRAFDLLKETGADVMLHADVIGPIMDGSRVTGLKVNCAEGVREFKAKVVIDATGNGIVAAAAGVPYEEGRDGDGLVQPMSIMFTVGGFDPKKRFLCYSEEDARSKRCIVAGKTWENIVQEEIAAGRLPPEVGVIRLYPGKTKDLVVVNATQVNGLFGSRSADLTKAEIATRKQAAQIVDVMRRHLPGHKNARISDMPAVVGVRETRRFEGVDRLTTEDVLSGRRREDAVARKCSFVMDIHNPAGAGQAHGHDEAVTGGARRVKPYDIPYGALVPKKIDGLLFCGRCISASHEALASCRVMGNAMATGIGAGAAAAEAVKKGIDVRSVDAKSLHLFDKSDGASISKPACQEAVSPDGRNRIKYLDGKITVFRDGKILFGPQTAALRLDRGEAKVELCARNDGVAYRFATDMEGEIAVIDETAALVFPSPDTELWVGYNWCDNPKDPKQDKLQHGCASAYVRSTPSTFVPDGRRIAYLPLTVRYSDGTTALVTETDLRDYAGWHLRRNSSQTRSLDGVFGKFPVRAKERNAGKHYRRVTERNNWIVKTRGRRSFPWRVFVIADSPIGLVEQRITRDLAAPPTGDYSWVKPGTSAWEWWNDCNLEGVSFKPGVNTATYKAYIDFAAEYGLGWILIDEGWNNGTDVFSFKDGFDLDAIVSYASSRGVRTMLWSSWRILDGRQDEIFAAFAKRGVAGFKIDFMERDDAEMLRFMEKTLATAAKCRLVIDFHGCGKPSGLETTYPNLVGIEGVRGLELMKMGISKGEDFMKHDCTVPFTRGPLGHVDYTPGAMRNLAKTAWQPDRHNPASQGTRVHQMALYTLFPVPFQMMSDSPSAYRRNPECARFIASVPTVWDDAKGLCGEIGKFAAVARRKGETWHIGAITDWTEREIEIDTSFLGDGEWKMTAFSDAADAARFPEHWMQKSGTIRAGEKIKARMAPGGGWTARFTKAIR